MAPHMSDETRIKTEVHEVHRRDADIEVTYEDQVPRNSVDYAKRNSFEKTNSTFLTPKMTSVFSLSSAESTSLPSPLGNQRMSQQIFDDVIDLGDDSDDEEPRKVINRLECPNCQATFGSTSDLNGHKCKKLPHSYNFDKKSFLDDAMSDTEPFKESRIRVATAESSASSSKNGNIYK